MFKKLLAMSTILGVAALLQNKERRDRLATFARDLMSGVRASFDKKLASTTGAGATTRHPVPTPHMMPSHNGTH